MASKDFCRPDPDRLLRQIQEQEAHDARGRLKIFLGYAPRVGKSLRMFDEGRRRRKRGQDVVIGAIQTKGSDALNEIIREFETIPPVKIDGAETVDVEAIVARRPQVCLIDELARDNPPGSRFTHRWQDVEALRKHGINVIGAINLQHVCEEQDAVERITGRRTANSVPTSFVNSADEIEIVDVPAGEVQASLSPEQLDQLRELALLLAAQVVEEQLQRYMDAHGIKQSWGTQERILVCITPRSSARVMLESGARATQRFHGQMLAVYVKQPELTREADETLRNNLEYAKKLGAEVHVLEGADPTASILGFAREQRITQVFIGHTQQQGWKFWAASPVDRLIKAAEGMDVRLFPHARPAWS
ncbi:MAG: sensor histidine kinase KdpD [Acidobacteriota bacterium]|nr:sensor histidine kinase KdpD [Acidobacteriota bacterium]